MAVRRRAVGTRERVIAHLGLVEEIIDPAGMASTRLAEAVGYPGSSVAFAQLLSGMERDGLIVREVRGKRTYRITVKPKTAEEPRLPHPAVADGALGEHPGTPGALDYDELADRVLLRLLRRLSQLSSAELEALERMLVRGCSNPEADKRAAEPAG
jgi:hypothetical protein